ncbi:hypothetical protein DPMN_071058 [Dreissena polymorpha]|uniref:Uncharacterized protein n=1 Tax=Dreissena polymorpha TaxID=45954 RepID=A0A9D3Z6Z8_DREPO|nr:hypothetical protein DPMN_071058 [Dreissena polymorpha]
MNPNVYPCNNALALFGRTNRLINLTRRYLLRPELRSDYAHLCNHSLPFTSELFGDDVGKQAKKIEDCNKICNRVQRGGYGGDFRRPGFRTRSRASPRGYMRGRGSYASHGSNQTFSSPPKNVMRLTDQGETVALKLVCGDLNAKMGIHWKMKRELNWWIQHSDASLSGWGFVIGSRTTKF